MEFVEEYKKNPIETGSKVETESETKGDKETKPAATTETETEEETEFEDYLDKHTGIIYYETKDELGKWLFDETAPAWDGDVKVIEETGSETEKETESKKPSSTETEKPSKASESESESETGKTETSKTKTYKTFKITVYMVRDHKGLDMEIAKSFGYFVTTHKESMEDFLEEFDALKSEDKTRDKFYDLADKYYEKYEKNHVHTDDEDHVDHSFNFQNVDHVKGKCFTNAEGFGTSFSKVDEWLDAEERESGDYTKKYIEVTTGTGDNKVTYYFALYFESHDKAYWYHDVFGDLTDKLIDEWYEAELKKDLIDFNDDAFEDITIVKQYPYY